MFEYKIKICNFSFLKLFLNFKEFKFLCITMQLAFTTKVICDFIFLNAVFFVCVRSRAKWCRKQCCTICITHICNCYLNTCSQIQCKLYNGWLGFI